MTLTRSQLKTYIERAAARCAEGPSHSHSDIP